MINTVNLLIQNLARASIKSKSQDNWSSPINMGTSFKHMSLDVMGEFGFGQPFDLRTSSETHFIPRIIVGTFIRGVVLLQCQASKKKYIWKIFLPQSSHGGWKISRYGEQVGGKQVEGR